MFFTIPRRDRHQQSNNLAGLLPAKVTDELVHPSRLLYTEEIVLSVCMVLTGLLYTFAQMPGTVVNTARSGVALVQKSVAGFGSLHTKNKSEDAVPLMVAARPMFDAISTATDLERRNHFGSTTAAAWEAVSKSIKETAFTTVATHNKMLPLWMLEIEQERAGALEEQLSSLLGKHREVLKEIRLQEMTPEQREVAAEGGSLDIPWRVVASILPEPQQTAAMKLCRVYEEAQENIECIEKSRRIVNYDYWVAIAKVANTPEGLEARSASQHAMRALKIGDLEVARGAYEKSLACWQNAFASYPQFQSETVLVREVAKLIDEYKNVLSLLDQPFDEAYELHHLAPLAG